MPLAPDVPYEIGDAAFGGYVAGIIDTTRGNIIAADASQTGLRYMLIVAPASLEHTSKQWKTALTAAPAATQTRWDGLSATQAMNTSEYPAAQYCASLSYPSDAGSPWYLPAMDELELIYRVLKATTEANYVGTRTGHEFPGGSQDTGYNPSSDPSGAAYTSTVPGQTSVLAFRDGGGQDLGDAGSNIYYWSATEYSASDAWAQYFSGSYAGYQNNISKTSYRRVRPVRRVLVSDLNTAPDAPTLTVPADGATLNRQQDQNFAWQHNDPDPGDSQSAYNFAYRLVGASTWTETGWVAVSTSQHTATANTFAEGLHEWRVATKDQSGAESGWSATRTFTAYKAATGTATISASSSATSSGSILRDFAGAATTPVSSSVTSSGAILRDFQGSAIVTVTPSLTSSGFIAKDFQGAVLVEGSTSVSSSGAMVRDFFGTGVAQATPQLTSAGKVSYDPTGLGVISVAHSHSTAGFKAASGTLTVETVPTFQTTATKGSAGVAALSSASEAGAAGARSTDGSGSILTPVNTGGIGKKSLYADASLSLAAEVAVTGARVSVGVLLVDVEHASLGAGHKWQRYFTPPGREVYGNGSRFWRRVHIEQGVTVIKRDGAFIQVEHPSADDFANADKIYIGGHLYQIDDLEHLDLEAAGYTTFYSEDGT